MRSLTVVLTLLLAAGCWSQSPESTLRRQIMENYDKDSLPNTFTEVSLRFTVVNLKMDEMDQTLMLDAWIAMEWNDPGLSWIASDYPNISFLAYPKDTVWKPDVTLYNSPRLSVLDKYSKGMVLGFQTGKVIYVPTTYVAADCVLDLTLWPRDVHTCTAKLGSWVYSGLALDLVPKDDIAEVEFTLTEKERDGMNLTHGHWDVVSSNVTRHVKYYPGFPDPYISVTVDVTVKRDGSAYTWTVILPAIVLCCLTGLIFFMPANSMEKLLVGSLSLILNMQFLAYTGDVIKYSPSYPPLIVQLVSDQMAVTMAVLVMSAIILRMTRDPHTSGPPRPIRRALSCLGSCCCLSGFKKLIVGSMDGSYPQALKGEELDMTGDVGRSPEQTEWLLLGALVDRFLLLLYIIELTAKLIRLSVIF